MIAKPLALPPIGLAPGQRIYAIGDVHGQAGQLQALQALIEADLAARPVRRPMLLYIGDLIDRGPDSAGVVQHILQQRTRPAVTLPTVTLPTVALLGNHEQMLLDILGTPDRARADRRAEHWMGHGGVAALQSWGVPVRAPVAEWHAHIPPAHLAFLRSLRPHWQAGACLFVHAGVRPGFSLAVQDRQDLLYMREPFLSLQRPAIPGLFVVHGHTPGGAPVLTPWRLCIDSGAGRGGPLTCAILQRDQLRFLQA